MKPRTKRKPWAGAIAAAITFAIPALAQWPAYPEGGPKTPEGKPDLNAPAPRTPDGKPDLSGVWWLATRNLALPGAGTGGAGANATPPAERGGGAATTATTPPDPNSPPLATFFNIAANFKEPLPIRPWAAELLNKRKSENSKDNPDAHCLPMGLMQFHLHPQPRKIIQTPKEVVIIYEANSGLRQIYLDGRTLPGEDAEPWWFGYSIGHWDGDTLVVETNGYRDDVWLDVWGTPMTNAAKTIERFRRPNYGTMQIDITIDDPKTYTKPFTVRVNHRLAPDSELIEFVCQDRDAPHYVGK